MIELAGKKVNYSIGISNLKKLYLMLKDAYYNKEALVDDAEFDKLEDYLKERISENWKGFKTGTRIKNKKVEMKLPVAMPSLNKGYPDRSPSIDDWIASSNVDEMVLMQKLDGAALEIVFEDGVPSESYTRGNGVLGKQMSYLIPHMKGIPKKISTTRRIIVRCEGLFQKSAYLKYKNEFKHDRGAANGILNSGTPHVALKDLSVVVVQILSPNVQLAKGLAWAKKQGFTVVPHKVVTKKQLNGEKLSTILANQRLKSPYKCDGLVLAENIVPPVPHSDAKPSWAIAFKENVSIDDAPKAKVVDIVYQISAHGWLIPKIKITPTEIDGTTVTNCSAKNMRWMLANGLGIGAIIRIVKSGEIIPLVVKVEKKSNNIPKPDRKEVGDYEWNEGKVDYVLTNPKENPVFRVAHIERFFNTLEIDFMREGNVQRLFDAGLNNVSKIIKASPKQIAQAEGIREGRAQALWDAIHRVIDPGVPLPRLMDASGVFPRGIGTRRMQMIAEHVDLNSLLKKDAREIEEIVAEIPRFDTTTARMVAQGMSKFVRWQEITGIRGLAHKKEKVIKGGKLSGMTIYITGYRDEEQEQTIKKNGGRIKWDSNTDVLLYSPSGKASSKVDKAKAKGIPVLTWEQFERKYL